MKLLPDAPHFSTLYSWRKTLASICIAVCLVGVGVLAGFFAGRTSKPAAPSADQVAAAMAKKYMQMPEYGTAAADALMNDPQASVYVKDMYALSDDTNIITEDLTRAFIDDLKQQLAANPHLFGGRNLTAHVDLNKCRKVARDILNYLRYTRSVAILQLLRRFSAGGGTLLALTDVDPNELRAEVGILMNVTTLNSYYAKMSNKGCDRKKRNITAPNVEAILTNSLVSSETPIAVAGRRLLHYQASRPHHTYRHHSSHHHHRHQHRLLQQSPSTTAATAATATNTSSTAAAKNTSAAGNSTKQTANGSDSQDQRSKRRVGPSLEAIEFSELGGRHLLHTSKQQQQQHRQLQEVLIPAAATPVNITADPAAAATAAAAAAAPAVVNLTAEQAAALAEAQAQATLMPTSLQEMLCSVQSYSPGGLKGVANFTCPANSTTLKAPFGQLTIPVVFHCFRFVDYNGVLQPPLWKTFQAAQNLVDVTNKFYNGSSIQFQLQDVRTDPEQYPYLLFDSLEEWQQCSRNDAATDQGMACLRDKATNPNVSTLTDDYVINIFVGGSALMPVYCKETDPWYSVCDSQALGFANPYGPWFGAEHDPNWREGLVSEEWFWMQYDEFSPIIRNHWRFWDAGACTVAHELGHYLGLRHTHQDDCAGNGVEAADAVPDTPANMEFWAYAHSVPAEHLNMQLAEWCTAFREGQNPRPQVQDLMKFDSCPSVNVEAVPQGDLVVDNVFNLLSYLPDACCMVLTRGQVARLHEMIVQYRPGLIAARSVGAV